MISKKRLFDEVNEALPSLLAESSPEELQELADQILAAKLKKQRQSEEENINKLIDALEEDYGKIEYGDSWKDDTTSNAVRQLERLDWKKIVSSILAVRNPDIQWKLAAKFTSTLGGIISEANDLAGKQVNGSMGAFCPDSGAALEKLWRKIIESKVFPSEKVLADVLAEIKLADKDLSDYDFADFSFVWNDKNLTSNKNKVIDLSSDV